MSKDRDCVSFSWFRRNQELHFVHHRHANSNFAVIHFFWDRVLGTYRLPDEHRVHPMALISEAMSIVAKLEKVSETA